MWKMIVLLWLVPLALAVVMLARVAEGSPGVNDDEWRLFLGAKKEMSWSPWLTIGFAALAVVFFAIGFLEGLVLANFGPLAQVAALLMTGPAAMFVLALCLRSDSHGERIAAQASGRSRARESHSGGFFYR